MNIPPVAPQSFYSNHSRLPEVQKLYDFWQDWYTAASTGSSKVKEKTADLIHFLKNHQKFFENLTKNTKEPFGPDFKESFHHLYNQALSHLEAWENHGCDKGLASSVSEWVGDVYHWCKAADPAFGT
jgi:hypothetical protein